MKTVKANLLRDVVSVYDQNKTTIQGRVTQKTVAGTTVLGPPLNKFVDVVTDTAAGSQVTPLLTYMSPNGRIFSVGVEASGIVPVSLHTIDLQTGAVVYIGTIRISLADNAATTHTYRGLKVIDDGVSGWRLFLASSGSVAINGGLYCVNNVNLSDFIPTGAGTLFPFATGSNQKATYFLQDPAAIGVGQLNIAPTGVTLDRANNRVFVHNGVAATHQFYVYSSNATLNCPLTVGVTIDSGTDFLTHTAHGYLNNDPIFLTNLSGGAGLINNTIYYVRNATANTYQVSTTTGGAAVNITTNGTVDVCRAFGTTSSAWIHKTGNLPALVGTLIQADSEDYAEPAHTTNAGQPCVFFCTSSNLYLGRLSELTPGATTWASLVTSNILGTVNQIATPTLSLATWSNVLDRAVYITNSNILVMKQVVNNSIDRIFGRVNNEFREAMLPIDNQGLGFLTAVALDIEQGWILVTGNATGQRGNFVCDLRSDALFDYSSIITPVLNTPDSIYKAVSVVQELERDSASLAMAYRTSGFASPTGGWINFTFGKDLTTLLVPGSRVQFKVMFDTLQLGASIPKQINELYLITDSLFGISQNWEVSRDLSSNLTPSRVVFRLRQTYGVSIPQMFFRAYDLSSNLILTADTVSNIGNFEYSTDNGLSWLPLGAVPNTIGALVRFTFSTPPGVDIRPSWKEE